MTHCYYFPYRVSNDDSDAAEMLPPADLPESRLFLLLQTQRRSLVEYLDRVSMTNSMGGAQVSLI